jgi:hypothetical protein
VRRDLRRDDAQAKGYMTIDAHGINSKSLQPPELPSVVALSAVGQRENVKLGHLARYVVCAAARLQTSQIAITRILLGTGKRIRSVRQERWTANMADIEGERSCAVWSNKFVRYGSALLRMMPYFQILIGNPAGRVARDSESGLHCAFNMESHR